MNDIEAKIFISKKLEQIRLTGHGSLEGLLRHILFDEGTKINWEKVSEEIRYFYPEENN